MKKILKKIKVVLTQLLAFILSFFKDTNLVYVKKVTVKKKIVDSNGEVKKEEKKEIITSTDTSTTLPDEAGTLEDKHIVIEDDHIINDDKLNYKQSIANVSDDIKDKVISKIRGKEIYFSEYIVLNTIIEALEEKNKFVYKDLSDNKKEKVKEVIEEINNKISPNLKKEMNNNKIKTKEDLKEDIKDRIDDLNKYNKKIKEILAIKEVIEVKEEPTTLLDNKVVEQKIEIVTEPAIEIKKEPEEVKVDIEELDEDDDKDLITIEKRDPDTDNLISIEKIDDDKDSLITIEKRNPSKDNLITIEKEFDSNDDLISIVKADKVEPRDKVYFIADLLSTRRDMKVKDTVKTSTSNTIVNDVKKEIAENIQDKSKKLPFVMVPTEKETKEEIEEKIKNVDITPTIIVKENNNDEQDLDLDAELDKDIDIEDNNNELLEVIADKEVMEKDIEKIQENIIKINELKEQVENTDKETFDEDNNYFEDKAIIELTKEKKEVSVEQRIREFNEEADIVIEDTKAEIIKENLEDKDYDKYEKLIDSLLLQIDEYLNNNRLKMLEKDIKSLKSIKNNLLEMKDKMQNQKAIDIETEKKELDDKITEDEIKMLEQEIKKMHLEHQAEIDDEVLEKLKEMEKTNDPKLEEFEISLIKKKLKRTSKLLEIPTLLALPFVRNKYFFYFTAGMLINNHFDFISAIFRRKEKRYEAIDLTPIKDGKSALEESLELTYRNIIYLDVLEEEAIEKYPHLREDEEFISYVEGIRNKLKNNYERLEKKQKMVEKYIYKVDKKNKVLKKYKLLRDKEAA